MRVRSWFLPTLALLLVSACLPPSYAEMTGTVTAPAAPPGLGLGPVTTYTLANGLQVLVAPSHAADLVTLDVWVKAGTRRETAQNNGAAHFIEHLLFKGTATRKPGEIDAGIENLGGSLNAATSYDWAHFYVTIGSSDADAALAILSDAVMNAALRPEDMDAERPVILNEMARDLSTPSQRLTQAFNALSFPNHPYGRPLLGTAANVSQMSRQTVLDFYKTYYVPGDVTLVIAGNVTPTQGLALAQKNFGTWAARPAPDDNAAPEDRQTEQRIRHMTAPTDQGYLMLGFHAPSVHDQPDTWVMDILLTWLGQGGNNRLEDYLQRKKKLVSAISANYLTQHDPGSLSIFAEFDPGDVDRVRDAILAEVASLRDHPLPDEDVSAAKHALLASYLFDAQTTSGRAGALGFYNEIDTYQYDTDYIAHFEAVTPAQVQAVARKYLAPDVYTLVTLLPTPDPMTASARAAGR